MRGQNITLYYNIQNIYDDCSFNINDTDKVGIVGVNGAGKTTLFKAIMGDVELTSGKIVIGNKRIGYLPQEIVIDDPDITVNEYLLSARPIKKLESELTTLYDKVAKTEGVEQQKYLNKIDKVQARLDYYDQYSYESILLTLMDNMDVDIDWLDMKLKDLSGGQKSKVAFLRLLYSKPEILLLDEPTNHLDVKSRNFITNYLKKYKGMVLIISHDVEFLNKIVNKIMYINKLIKLQFMMGIMIHIKRN